MDMESESETEEKKPRGGPSKVGRERDRWIRLDDGPNLRTAKDRRRAWRAATGAAEEIRLLWEWTEEVQRHSNDEVSCWSKENLLKTRIRLKEEVSKEAEMLPQ